MSVNKELNRAFASLGGLAGLKAILRTEAIRQGKMTEAGELVVEEPEANEGGYYKPHGPIVIDVLENVGLSVNTPDGFAKLPMPAL